MDYSRKIGRIQVDGARDVLSAIRYPLYAIYHLQGPFLVRFLWFWGLIFSRSYFFVKKDCFAALNRVYFCD